MNWMWQILAVTRKDPGQNVMQKLIQDPDSWHWRRKQTAPLHLLVNQPKLSRRNAKKVTTSYFNNRHTHTHTNNLEWNTHTIFFLLMWEFSYSRVIVIIFCFFLVGKKWGFWLIFAQNGSHSHFSPPLLSNHRILRGFHHTTPYLPLFAHHYTSKKSFFVFFSR